MSYVARSGDNNITHNSTLPRGDSLRTLARAPQWRRRRRQRRWFRRWEWFLSSTTCPRTVSHHREFIRDFIERRKVIKRSYEVSVVIHGRHSCCRCLLVACAVAVARRGWNVPKHSGRRRLRPNTAPTADPHHGSRRRLQQRCEYATTASVMMGDAGRGAPATTP